MVTSATNTNTDIQIAEQNTKLYYWVSALSNMWFMEAVWIYHFRIYASDTQIGWIDGLAFTFALLVEIPSGALADRFGRKKIYIIGLASAAISMAGLGLATSNIELFIWNFLLLGSMSLVSGADEALVYDSVLNANLEDKWDSIKAKQHRIVLLVVTFSTIVGGLLFLINTRLPFIAFSIIIIGAIFLALKYTETDANTLKANSKASSYLETLLSGIRHLLLTKNRHLALLTFGVLGLWYTFDWGALRPLQLDSFGYNETRQPYAAALILIISAIAVGFVRHTRLIFNTQYGIYIVSAIAFLFFLATAYDFELWTLIPLCLSIATLSILSVWLNDLVQRSTDSNKRSTVLSAFSFLYKLPLVLVSPLSGIYSDGQNISQLVVYISVILLVFILISYILFIRNSEKNYEHH